MKLLLIILVALVAVQIRSERPVPSFMKHVGSYLPPGEHPQSTRNFYLSQRIQYSWISAYTFCKLNGMKLAVAVDHKGDVLDLFSIINEKLSQPHEFFVDSKNNNSAADCLSLKNYELHENDCLGTQLEFLCEDSEAAQKLQTTKAPRKTSVNQRFFNYLGDYGTMKSYHMSTKLQLAPDNAIKACRSLDMTLAAPQDQHEFDNLKNLLRNTSFEWENAAIAGYRVADNWFDSGRKLNYEINWGRREPNDAKNNEYCIFMQTKDNVSVNDDPCTGFQFPFICEVNHARLSQVTSNDEGEVSRFLRPVAFFDNAIKTDETDKKTEMFLSHDQVKLVWFDAVLLCKSLGMEILAPESNEAFDKVKDLLRSHPTVDGVHVGLTNVGSESDYNGWYSVNSGKLVKDLDEVEIAPHQFYISYQRYNMFEKWFLMISKKGENYKNTATDGVNHRANFICHNVASV